MRSPVSFFLFLSLLFPKISSGGEDPWWGKDKVRHFALSYITVSFLRSENIGEPFDREEAFYITLSLGIGKEIWDHFVRKKEFSFKDLTYDLLGCLFGLI